MSRQIKIYAHFFFFRVRVVLFDDRDKRILKNPRTIKSLPLKKSKASFEPAWIDLRSVKGILLKNFPSKVYPIHFILSKKNNRSTDIANNHYDRFILLPTIFSGNLLTPSEIKLIDIQKVILTRSYRVSYRTLTFIAESGNEKKI